MQLLEGSSNPLKQLSEMTSSISLTGLSTREAIADALYRGVQGIDTNNVSLFKSALVDLKEFTFEVNGFGLQGEEAVMGTIFNFVGPMDTLHTISNIRIDVKDDAADTAVMTAYAVARHHRKGEGPDPTTPHLTTGGIYTLDLVQDRSDGLWKARKWAANFIWRDGDESVTAREGFPTQ
jgi:hypothetical protein